eukprot:TRINITY_DN39262_c0_g1_i1.p1 TRINITY_DN39262_c0_g1~~TRINITY_DN39262_c0_g1_i1.p1  ORF type:complete len:396 (-),score=75.50 TRINITY_DN39262_c0_g1_i1:570-1757(-)
MFRRLAFDASLFRCRCEHTYALNASVKQRFYASPAARAVPRVDARRLRREELEQLIRRGPVLVANAFPELDHDSWCRTLASAAANEVVNVKEVTSDGEAWMLEASLFETLSEILPSSCHDHSFSVFDEDFLARRCLVDEGLAELVSLPTNLVGENWFRHFPPHVRPSAACLVIAGTGTRSSCHRDPFEWTGTSYCVSGSKLWTFFPPPDGDPSSLDASLRASRFPYESFDAEGQPTAIAAGWQADLDVYAVQHATCPSASALVQMEVSERHCALEVAADAISNWWIDNTVAAPLKPATMAKVAIPDAVKPVCVEHKAGELLFIPGNWWHQTYALEPSIAVSGQYMNSSNCSTIMHHIARWRGISNFDIEQLQALSPEEQVSALFRSVSSHDGLLV